ncbi:MAG: GDYXXLXY domain-containing protein [Parasphingorhabdus sp.]
MSHYRHLFLPLALLLPLIGLGLIWWIADRESQQGTEWDVPIAGYDPRDLLRGHYVQFRYDWPAVGQEDIPLWSASRKSLCIRGTAPDIDSVEVRDIVGTSQPVDHGCDATAKANPWSEEGNDGLIRDRIYVAQEAGRSYEKKLADPKLQGIVRIRINNSGFITPLSLSFQPRREGDSEQENVQ